MKKAGILLISLLFLNLLAITLIQTNLTKAQETPPGLPPQLGQDPEELIEGVKNKTETEWQYLSKEWPKIFLKNELISAADTFFTKISIVFRILFGQPYSFSITLLAIIILWLFIVLKSGDIINSWGLVKGWSAYLIGAALAIILAQIQVLKMIINFLGWLVFAKKGTLWNISMILVIILIFVLLYYLFSILSKYLKEREKKKREKETETRQKALEKFTKGLIKK